MLRPVKHQATVMEHGVENGATSDRSAVVRPPNQDLIGVRKVPTYVIGLFQVPVLER